MDQPKKYRVLLKPLPDRNLKREIRLARKFRNYPDAPYHRANLAELEARLVDQQSKGQPRVLDVDMVKIIDDGTLLMGIGPSNRTYVGAFARSGRNHAKGLRIRRENPEFYDLKHTPPGRKPHDPSHTDYILTRKFNKILSANIENVISINGKPVMDTRGIDKGVRRLDLDEGWSVDNISRLLDE